MNLAHCLLESLRSRFTLKHMLKVYVWVTAVIAIGQVVAYVIHFDAYSPSRFKKLCTFAFDFLFAAPYGIAVYFSFLAMVIFALLYSIYVRRLKAPDTVGTPRQHQRPIKYLCSILLDVGLYALSFIGTLLFLRIIFVILTSLFN